MYMLDLCQQKSPPARPYRPEIRTNAVYVTRKASGYRFISALMDIIKILQEPGAWIIKEDEDAPNWREAGNFVLFSSRASKEDSYTCVEMRLIADTILL